MKLEQSDAELFYQLWFPLLDFVNRKHHVCPETETIGQRKGIDARNAKKTLGCLLLYAARFDAYGLTVQLIHHGDEAVDIVVLVLLCVAFRVGLGNHIARQIVGKGLRCAVGVGHLLQQAFGGVGTPKIIL